MFRLPRRLAGWVVWRPTQFDVAATGNFRAVGCQPLVAHAKVNAQVCLNSEFGFRSKEFCRFYCKRSYWTEFVYQIYQTDSLKVARAFVSGVNKKPQLISLPLKLIFSRKAASAKPKPDSDCDEQHDLHLPQSRSFPTYFGP